MSVIEIAALEKDYRRLRGGTTRAVDGLDLVVEAGGVYGFLGPNGSGKTTTIRCLLGLARPTSGDCRIFGKDSQTQLATVIARVGSIVEGPALFPAFSARRNLALLARLHCLPPRRVDDVLELVGLAGRENELVKNYSLGMRQRLAIGAALLKDPELLILDEPANGLDPAGIREVRQLLRRLGRDGRTIFVSSHILSEVQQTCDQVAILSRGRCVACGPVSEVLARGTAGIMLRIDELQRAVAVLAAAGFTTDLRDGALRVEAVPEQGARIAKALADHGLYPTELRPETVDLEKIFFELTEQVAA